MKLTDFYILLEKRGLDKETVNSYFQQAYESVVDEVRLDQSIHPLRLSGAGQIGGFEYPVILYPSKSKMAFKEVNKYLKADIQSSYDKEKGYTIRDIEGIDPTDSDMLTMMFDAKENDTIFIHGTDIVTALPSEIPNTMIVVTGYVYPYPLLVTNYNYSSNVSCTLSSSVSCNMSITADTTLTTTVDCTVGEPRQGGDYVVSCNLWQPAGHEPDGDYVVSCDEWGG